jgi:putative SOS response-associated peptidase YedK
MCLRFAWYWLNKLNLDQFFWEMRNADYLPGFEQYEGPQIGPRYNIGPAQMVLNIRRTSTGTTKAEWMKWGFVPSFAKEKPKYLVGNARAETLKTSPVFKSAFQRQRCLIPASGFYEPKGEKAKKGTKYRPWFYFQMREAKPFFFGGLWSRSHLDKDKPLDTFTLITTKPNEIVGEIHDRMPLILRPKDFPRWLGDEDASDLLEPYPADDMDCWPVSDAAKRTVKSDGSINDDPSMIEPIKEPK